MKHYKPVEFCQFLECQAPLHKHKVPLLKTFWRQFCVDIYTKTWNHRKTLRKKQKTTTYCIRKEY